MATRMVWARSAAEMPVVTPSAASIDSQKPCRSATCSWGRPAVNEAGRSVPEPGPGRSARARAGHEVDGFRGDKLGGHGEVALVFAVLVITTTSMRPRALLQSPRGLVANAMGIRLQDSVAAPDTHESPICLFPPGTRVRPVRTSRRPAPGWGLKSNYVFLGSRRSQVTNENERPLLAGKMSAAAPFPTVFTSSSKIRLSSDLAARLASARAVLTMELAGYASHSLQSSSYSCHSAMTPLKHNGTILL